jgi:hypothetical protein
VTANDAFNRTILLCRDYVAGELADEQIAQAFHQMRVLCVGDRANLSCHSAQTALMTLVSLLSRMGMQVELRIPEVAMHRAQPPFDGSEISTALISASTRLMPHATIASAADGNAADIVFSLGSSKVDYGTVPMWRMSGADWSGSIHSAGGDTTPMWMTEWPIGGMVSAVLAANEAFKLAMRRLALRQTSDEIFFEAATTCSWDFGALSLPANDLIDLGRVDFISAGAITQAALYVLARLPGAKMQGRVLDDDSTALSNLNRNMLTMVEDVNLPKVDVIVSRCSAHFPLDPVAQRFESSRGTKIQLAPRVIVGVDDIPSRWEVQRDAPGWVGVGGTSHFSISSSSHAMGEPCSGCLHPLDDPDQRNPIPTVSFVSFWAGLCTAVRLIREALGSAYPAARQHLWLTPLRLDQRHAAIWSPVPPLRNCPVRCAASRSVA